MKHTDLIRKIRAAAGIAGLSFELRRNDGSHEVWVLDGFRFSVPRHREVNELTARDIMGSLETKLGKDWWR